MSYRKTFSSWATEGSTSRGMPRSRIHSGRPRRRATAGATRSQVTTACGAAVELSTMSASAKCSHASRSEEHTSELQSLAYLVCRLLLEKKKNKNRRRDLERGSIT